MSSNKLLVLVLAVGVAGCGAEADDVPPGSDVCGFDSDRYLPYQPGLTWTYQITDLDSGARAIKDQHLEEEIDPELGPVLVQITGKLAGSTRSLFQIDGDRVVRLQQDDLDSAGTVKRTTVFDPGRIRIDESPARLVVGTRWDEVFVETKTEPAEEPRTLTVTDQWQVLGTDVACQSPLGTFSCLHLGRTSTDSGETTKEYFFARGVGKVREVGGKQTEEIMACGQ